MPPARPGHFGLSGNYVLPGARVRSRHISFSFSASLGPAGPASRGEFGEASAWGEQNGFIGGV